MAQVAMERMDPGVLSVEDSTPESDELEAALWGWAEPFEKAISKGGPIVALDLWKPASYLALLPSHLSLSWPDLFSNWPLNASYGIVPLTAACRDWLSCPLYRVA